MNFKREDFAQRGKKKRPLVSTSKKVFNPVKDANKKILTLSDIAKALEDVAPQSIVHTAVPKPKVDFVREVLTVTPMEKSCDIASIDDIILMSDSITSFTSNLTTIMTVENIKKIETSTRGQSSNESWYHHRKGVITASKCHDVHTKMVKVNKCHTSTVDMWPLHQKISGLVYIC